MQTNSTDRVVGEAARWYARLQAPDCTQQERDEFARWQQENNAHREAYSAAERLAGAFSGAAADNPRLRAMTEQALAMGRGSVRDIASRPLVLRRSWLIPGSLAAGIVAAVLAVGFSGLAPQKGEVAYAAASDTQRELRLTDGTAVHLDIGSAIEVRMTASARDVTLTKGRALFDVAHDVERPFHVTAGAGRVTALGTLFQVHRRGEKEVVVTLAEGAVEVSGELQGRPQRERLSPGEEIRIVERDTAWRKRRVDAVAATSWSLGRHVFRDVRLADALDEVNRYATRKVVIADTTLADLSVSGSFMTGDSESVVSAFAAVLPIRIEESGGELLLFRRREGYSDN